MSQVLMTRKETRALALEVVVNTWRIRLQRLAEAGELLKASKQALGLDEIPERLEEIDRAVRNNNWHLLPPIAILSGREIGIARAAWSDTEKQIYINKNWLKTAGENEIHSVLDEEFGHFLDNLVKSDDTSGDEGYVFSQILLSGSSGLNGKRFFSYENDHIVISL